MSTGIGAPPWRARGDCEIIGRTACCERDRDDRLAAAVGGGDERAFELLFSRYRAPIGAYVSSLVRDPGHSEDVTQEVFISALRSLRMGASPAAVRPWLYEIARNACIDRHRRSRRGEEFAGGAGAQLPTDGARVVSAPAESESELDARARFAELREALLDMPALDRRLLVMREFEGRSYREIVECSGLTTPAVESALFRARRRLIERTGGLSDGEDRAAWPAAVLDAGRPARRTLAPLRRATSAGVASVSSSP
jgi:RNA polymerase sigma factor (sigma-70 family)